MRTILVGYDGSEVADRALDRARELADAFGAQLVVLAVAELPVIPGPELMPEPTVPGALPAAPLGARSSEEAQLVDEPARELLGRARERLPSRLPTTYVSAVGDPADALLDVAEERDADLIVVGSHTHGFLDRLLRGATDERVARKAQQDVLLVH